MDYQLMKREYLQPISNTIWQSSIFKYVCIILTAGIAYIHLYDIYRQMWYLWWQLYKDYIMTIVQGLHYDNCKRITLWQLYKDYTMTIVQGLHYDNCTRITLWQLYKDYTGRQGYYMFLPACGYEGIYTSFIYIAGAVLGKVIFIYLCLQSMGYSPSSHSSEDVY